MASLSDSEVQHLFRLEQQAQLFEKLITTCYQNILTHGDTAIDVGAHKGWHTIPMARAVGPAGKVHAFEAIPTLARELRELIAGEKLDQVELHGQAVSCTAGAAIFHWVRNGEGVSGLRARDIRAMVPDPDVSVIHVEVTTLDTLPLQNCRFCKLDIEGAELDALRGGQSAIREHGPMIVFENGRGESGSVYGYSRDDYFSFFTAAGYTQFDLFGRPFGPEQWDLPYIPWNTIAVVADSADEEFVRHRYPDILHDQRRACELQAS